MPNPQKEAKHTSLQHKKEKATFNATASLQLSPHSLVLGKSWGKINVYNPQTFSVTATFESNHLDSGGEVQKLIKMADGSIAILHKDSTVNIWDMQNDSHVTIPPDGNCRNPLLGRKALLALPNGDLACGYGDGALKFYSKTGKLLDTSIITKALPEFKARELNFERMNMKLLPDNQIKLIYLQKNFHSTGIYSFEKKNWVNAKEQKLTSLNFFADKTENDGIKHSPSLRNS